jgi:hypothetical protein
VSEPTAEQVEPAAEPVETPAAETAEPVADESDKFEKVPVDPASLPPEAVAEPAAASAPPGEPVCPFCPIRSLSHGTDGYQCLECGRSYKYANPGVEYHGDADYTGPTPEREPEAPLESQIVASESGSHPAAIVGEGAEPQQGLSVPHNPENDLNVPPPPPGPTGAPDEVTTTENYSQPGEPAVEQVEVQNETPEPLAPADHGLEGPSEGTA